LGEQQMGNGVQIVRDYTSAIQKVAVTPGGISYSSASIAIGQKTVSLLSLAKASSQQYVSPFISPNHVNIAAFRDGTYPLTRRLFVVIRQDGTLDEQAGIAYARLLLSETGQKIIEEAGFAALY
jgi:phosphate transport system substrate-binding protein